MGQLIPLRAIRRRARARGRQGFTLLEVVVAMGILATGLLAVAAAQLYAMRGGRSGRHTTDAAEIAQTQVEAFQRMDWTDAALNATAGWSPPGGVQRITQVQTAAGVPAEEQAYRLEWRITNVNAFLKTIDVRVTWNEPNRPNRSYTITTARHNDAES
jgi:prepilin-type N-terminal cleavage/methylation domain-containing protein